MTMIEVTCWPSGDHAEAEDPEAAIVAARTLCEDDWTAYPLQGRKRTVTFTVDGKVVRQVPEAALWIAPS